VPPKAGRDSLASGVTPIPTLPADTTKSKLLLPSSEIVMLLLSSFESHFITSELAPSDFMMGSFSMVVPLATTALRVLVIIALPYLS
jgi:hypothetical protein